MACCTKSKCFTAAAIITILFSALNVGMNSGVVGATLPDLAQYTNVPITTASTVITWRSIAYLISALTSSFLLDCMEGHLVLGVASVLQALTVAISAWFTSFVIMSIVQAISYYFTTTLMVGLTCLAFQLDISIARPTAQAGMLVMNVGKTLVPFVMAPFLSQPINNTGSTPAETPTTNTVSTTTETPETTTYMTIDNSTSNPLNYRWVEVSGNSTSNDMTPTHVAWGYVLLGLYALFTSVFFFIMVTAKGCRCRPTPVEMIRTDSKRSEEKPQFSKCWSLLIIVLFCLIVFCQNGIEALDANLLLTVVSEYMGKPKTTGLLMQGIYQGIKVVVCSGTMLFINRVHPSIILIIDLVFMLVGSSVMAVAVVVDLDPLLWTGMVCISTGMANFYATTFIWLEIYFPISGRMSGLMSVMFGFSAMVFPPITTGLLEVYGAVAFPLSVLVLTAVCTVILLPLKLVVQEKCCSRKSPVTEENSGERQPLMRNENDQRFIFYNNSSDWSTSEEWRTLGN